VSGICETKAHCKGRVEDRGITENGRMVCKFDWGRKRETRKKKELDTLNWEGDPTVAHRLNLWKLMESVLVSYL